MSDKAEPGYKTIVRNRKAYFEYQVVEKFEAGIELKGTEVKSIRDGKVTIGDTYAVVRDDELWLMELDIATYSHGNLHNHDPRRPRRLLMRKAEIKRLRSRVLERGLTIVALRVYFTPRGWAKVELAVVRGKTSYDKRDAIKKRDSARDLKRHYGV